jgi:L-ascorbate metabolism protein UlaG (beta-lactamase superfamily)
MKINRREFMKYAAYASAAGIVPLLPLTSTFTKYPVMRFRLLRHATLLLEIAGKKILVDPMLSKKDALDPVKNAANSIRIPMVDMPIDETALNELLKGIDLVLVTHTHRDHWDVAAQQMIAKDKLIICQASDETIIKGQGFTNVQPIGKSFTWNGMLFYRTNGQHGTGETAKAMGKVSGYVVEYGKQRLYIAGDTIWCSDVEEAINEYHPDHIIVNGGGAQFIEGGPITITTDDLVQLSEFSPARISVVHLDTVNHCIQRRSDFRKVTATNHLGDRIFIPEDGNWSTV